MKLTGNKLTKSGLIALTLVTAYLVLLTVTLVELLKADNTLLLMRQEVDVDGATYLVGGTEPCPKPMIVFVLGPPTRHECLNFSAGSSAVAVTLARLGPPFGVTEEVWRAGPLVPDARSDSYGMVEFTRPNGRQVSMVAFKRADVVARLNGSQQH